MRGLVGLGVIAASVGLMAWVVPGCGGDDSSTFDPNGQNTDGGGGGPGDDGGNPFNTGDGSMNTGDTHQCVNLECKQVTCMGGAKTTVSGTVYDPAGNNPLYNVAVYVPNAPLAPIVHGASCDKCGATLSGSPLVSALTDAKGNFSLENVPVDSNVPLVIQIGKWRRVISLPSVTACTDNPITDATKTRLARKPAEFDPNDDIPQIAMTTGGADPLECLPRKIGIADDQFNSDATKGRVQLYQGFGGSSMAGTTGVQPFWSDVTNLSKYDVVMLGCEGGTHPENKPQAALDAMYNYASMGGRIFGSHFHYYWIQNGDKEWPSTATWNHTKMPDPIDGTIDTSFPKGMAFSDWMTNVKATNGPSTFNINQPRHDVNDPVNSMTSVRWVYNTAQNADLYYSFNTPVSAPSDMQCGKVVYSDLHVSSGDTTGGTFPGNCQTTMLSPQEKALEFMLFDLSSCIQNDTQPPMPPPTPPPVN